jgi:hypothetical protein
MRYFTYGLISAANDWIEQTAEDQRSAERRLLAVTRRYEKQLNTLEPRLSREAWRFFRFGRGRESLHDARLISACIGDGLEFAANGKVPFRLNRQRTTALLKFLNYEQDRIYLFDLRKVSRFSGDLFRSEDSYAGSIGDLYTYELTAANSRELQLGFLFASGASMVIQCERLLLRKRRLQREYELGDIYE